MKNWRIREKSLTRFCETPRQQKSECNRGSEKSGFSRCQCVHQIELVEKPEIAVDVFDGKWILRNAIAA